MSSASANWRTRTAAGLVCALVVLGAAGGAAQPVDISPRAQAAPPPESLLRTSRSAQKPARRAPRGTRPLKIVPDPLAQPTSAMTNGRKAKARPAATVGMGLQFEPRSGAASPAPPTSPNASPAPAPALNATGASKPALASVTDKAAAPAAAEAAQKPVAATPKAAEKCDAPDAQVERLVQKFCSGNTSALEEARLAWQRKRLEEAEQRLRDSMAAMDKKISELRAAHEAIAAEKAAASEKIVRIFSEMKPDAAALQLSSMEEVNAKAIIAAMPAKTASLILNEMQPKKAAQLAERLVAQERRAPPSLAK